MQSRIRSAGLADIDDRLRAGERLECADGVRLFECPDLLAVGSLANREREKRHGARTYFNYNLRLEPTNVCEASCLFCSFARLKPSDAAAYTMSLEEAWDKLRRRAHQPLTELHIVNGLNPDLPFSYYTELLAGFNVRGRRSFEHRILTCELRGSYGLFDGVVEGLPNGNVGGFLSTMTLDGEGRIRRYLSFYCEPAAP